jgi:hypothetical protein
MELICEKCLKEHNGKYGSGRFCSSSCSRSFSTVTNRNEINRKISEKLKINGNGGMITLDCIYCKKNFTTKRRGNRNQRYCSNSCSSSDISDSSRLKISEKMKLINKGEKNPMFGRSPKNTSSVQAISDKHHGDSIFNVRSTYEREYVELLNDNDSVLYFVYEPKKYRCEYEMEGVKRTYQPDFYVKEIDYEYVTEVKALWQLETNETIAKKDGFIRKFTIPYKIWIKENKRK